MLEVVAGMDEEVFTGMDEEVVNANASRDMFEESVNEEPYRLSQVGAPGSIKYLLSPYK